MIAALAVLLFGGAALVTASSLTGYYGSRPAPEDEERQKPPAEYLRFESGGEYTWHYAKPLDLDIIAEAIKLDVKHLAEAGWELEETDSCAIYDIGFIPQNTAKLSTLGSWLMPLRFRHPCHGMITPAQMRALRTGLRATILNNWGKSFLLRN